MTRVLVVPLASASPVVAQHVESLREILARAGAEPRVLRPRMRIPPASEGARWLAAYAPVQMEHAWRVAREARRGDAVLLFLGAHHLAAALSARLRGARVVYVPGGSPSAQARAGRPLVRAVERAVAALSHVVGVESSAETRAWPRARALAARGVALPPLLDKKDHLVAFVGRLEEHKGVRAFAEAARRAAPGDPEFVVAGAGSLAIAGARWLTVAQRDALLARAKLVVVPSRDEGLPTVALEAMARGTPALATRVGGVPEVVRDRETGWILEDASPDGILAGVRRALADPRYEDVRRRARELVAERYSLEAAAERYRGLLSCT